MASRMSLREGSCGRGSSTGGGGGATACATTGGGTAAAVAGADRMASAVASSASALSSALAELLAGPASPLASAGDGTAAASAAGCPAGPAADAPGSEIAAGSAGAAASAWAATALLLATWDASPSVGRSAGEGAVFAPRWRRAEARCSLAVSISAALGAGMSCCLPPGWWAGGLLLASPVLLDEVTGPVDEPVEVGRGCEALPPRPSVADAAPLWLLPCLRRCAC